MAGSTDAVRRTPVRSGRDVRAQVCGDRGWRCSCCGRTVAAAGTVDLREEGKRKTNCSSGPGWFLKKERGKNGRRADKPSKEEKKR